MIARTPSTSDGSRGGAPRGRALHLFACFTCAATFVLIFAGGLVTSTGSALSVPDWPLSYGQLMPPMVGGVRFEHGHRMVAGFVAILTTILAAWIGWREPRGWVKGLGFAALGAIVAQAVLGGLTVLFLLPVPISVAHACLGQTFFCMTVALALVTSPRWHARAESAGPRVQGPSAALAHVPASLRRLALVALGAVYLQLVLGAIMRHTGAGLAIPDFPLSYGRLVPPSWPAAVAIHFAHRGWAVAVLALVGTLAVRLLAFRRERPDLARPALLLLTLLPVQIGLGAATVLTRKMVVPTTAHVAVGALLLGTTLVLAIRTRLARVEPRVLAQNTGRPDRTNSEFEEETTIRPSSIAVAPIAGEAPLHESYQRRAPEAS